MLQYAHQYFSCCIIYIHLTYIVSVTVCTSILIIYIHLTYIVSVTVCTSILIIYIHLTYIVSVTVCTSILQLLYNLYTLINIHSKCPLWNYICIDIYNYRQCFLKCVHCGLHYSQPHLSGQHGTGQHGTKWCTVILKMPVTLK